MKNTNNLKSFKSFNERNDDVDNYNKELKNKFIHLKSDVVSDNEKINVGRNISFKIVSNGEEFIYSAVVDDNTKYNRLDVEIKSLIKGNEADMPYQVGEKAVVHVGNIVNAYYKVSETKENNIKIELKSGEILNIDKYTVKDLIENAHSKKKRNVIKYNFNNKEYFFHVYNTGNKYLIKDIDDNKLGFVTIEQLVSSNVSESTNSNKDDSKPKGLSVSLYQSNYKDSLSILPKNQQYFLLVDETGKFPELALHNVKEGEVYLKLKSMSVGNKIHYFAVPSNLEKGVWSMFGGKFVYSSDSRFSAICGYPISIHDRVEN